MRPELQAQRPPGAMAPNPFFEAELARLKAGGYDTAARRAFWRALRRRATENATARPELVRELRVIRWGGVVVALAVGWAIAASGVQPIAAFVLPALWWLVLTAWVGVELGLVRHPLTDAPSSAIGVANVISLFRGWAGAPAALLGTLPHPTPTMVTICVAAGFSDFIDGTVAGLLGQQSRLGRLLDPVVDAFFFSAVGWALAHFGLVPWWLAAIITARYFVPLIGGIALMLVRGRTLPVQHTPWGQVSTGLLGLALLAHWLTTVVALPLAVPLTLDGLTLLSMALALRGIFLRAPLK